MRLYKSDILVLSVMQWNALFFASPFVISIHYLLKQMAKIAS